MSSKFNQRIVLLAFNIGLVLSGSVAANVMAAECKAKLVEAGSTGVSVSKNTSTCQESSKITLGSVLELSPGSRMWLKFDPNSTGESFQLICQNRSASTIAVNVASTAAPWIKPQGLKNCEQWKNSKLRCGSEEEKTSFFCAIASARPEKTKNPMEVTTSVKMRGFPIQPAVSPEDVIKGIQPDIELCKNLYNVSEKTEMSWTVVSLGIIKDLKVSSDNQDFITCVEGVVKQANSNQDVSVKHSF